MKLSDIEKEKTSIMIEEDLREKVFFKNKVGLQNSLYLDQDIESMIDVLNTLKYENNIFEGMSDKERNILELTLNSKDNNYQSLAQVYKDNYKNEEEEKIISKIEDLVNTLIQENKIDNINIKQVEGNDFEFNGIKLIVQKNDQDTIVVNSQSNQQNAIQETLENWLVNNFPFKQPKYLEKTNAAYQSIQKSLNKAVERTIARKSVMKLN